MVRIIEEEEGLARQNSVHCAGVRVWERVGKGRRAKKGGLAR